jgi:hypothetical protein
MASTKCSNLCLDFRIVLTKLRERLNNAVSYPEKNTEQPRNTIINTI